ncbi:hypothetical protein D5086_012921 [Populus alba]|uniref:Uncharacterized protein n=1 Tax=Populus alba TaxID=43335 RepID=A0ACC4C3H7_POPAL
MADSTSTKSRKRRQPDPDSTTELLFKNLLKPDSVILQTLQSLVISTASASSSKPLTLSDLSLSSSCREVTDLSLTSVQSEIEALTISIVQSILSGKGFSFNVPSRAATNQLYVPELDRIVLKDKNTLRPFANISSVRKCTITARILSLIHQLSLKGIHVTKRDLFYTDVKLFQDQTQSDAVLDDVSCMLGCTRSSLNVIAAEKGVVVGRLIFSDNGDMIDCTKMGMGGKAIPPNIDRVGDMQSDALFILLVEKDAAYMSANLTTPDIKWLGIRPSDLDKYKIPEQCRLPMTEQDIKTGKDLLEEDFVKKNPGWVEELSLMVKTKQKAEIQALSSFGFQYLSEVYLPLKLQQQDWL